MNQTKKVNGRKINDVFDEKFIYLFYFSQRVSTSKFARIQKYSIKKNHFQYENKNKIIIIEIF